MCNQYNKAKKKVLDKFKYFNANGLNNFEIYMMETELDSNGKFYLMIRNKTFDTCIGLNHDEFLECDYDELYDMFYEQLRERVWLQD